MDNMTNSSLLDVGKYINWTENETVVIDHPVYSDPMAYLIITQTIMCTWDIAKLSHYYCDSVWFPHEDLYLHDPAADPCCL